MKVGDIVEKVKSMDYPQKLEKKWDCSCPCFYYEPVINGHKTSIHGHCWRTTKDGIIGSCDCAYNGLHIKSKLPKKDQVKIAKAFKKQLDMQKWYSPWDVRYEK